eukprot:TRINITY_DN49301_c0_g1_i1.p1 TRINITY_DN49301_c0_g1~~TRINITY_DN49301_c0_g1_i1.p1  ORF type:complete len:353 (-),score=55.23 TRINITY_DN49301_c0_g1_i1:149-1207(-)
MNSLAPCPLQPPTLLPVCQGLRVGPGVPCPHDEQRALPQVLRDAPAGTTTVCIRCTTVPKHAGALELYSDIRVFLASAAVAAVARERLFAARTVRRRLQGHHRRSSSSRIRRRGIPWTQRTGREVRCPACGAHVPDLPRHLRRCCPEMLEKAERPSDGGLTKGRWKESEGDWRHSEEELAEASISSVEELKDPLLRKTLQLRFGLDRGGLRRTPLEVANALGGEYAGNGQYALTLVRTALRATPLVADDPSRLDILYEDDKLLAVAKPPFVRCTPTHRFLGKSMVNQIIGYYKQASAGSTSGAASASASFPAEPYLVHRLDQETSGVLLTAKEKTACAFLKRQWHCADVRKE